MTTGFSLFSESAGTQKSGSSGNVQLSALAYGVLEILEENDFAALSRAAHPQQGVIFSPCATISPEVNKHFEAGQIAAFKTDTNIYMWGVSNVDGHPIEMTAVEYVNEFVYNRDYTAATLVGINTIVKSGNALENITEVFPDIEFVDFLVPGDQTDTGEDLGWGILRLGFDEFDGEYKLTLILNSSWTG